MKIKIKKLELEKIINVIEHAISSKTVLEALKGIKLVVKNDKIIFTTSKQEMAIEYILENKDTFEIYETGEVLIPAHFFMVLIKKSNEEEFILSKFNNSLLIETTTSKVDIKIFDLNSYPIINFSETNTTKVNLDTNLLKNAYNQTKYSVALNAMKPILTGINYKFSKSELLVESTDAKRLSISSFEIENDINVNFTISKSIMYIIIKICEIEEVKNIDFNISSNQLILELNNVKIKARLLEGNYPNLIDLVPKEKNFSYEVSCSELKPILEKIILLSERNKGNITAKIENNKLSIKSYFQEFGTIEEVCNVNNIIGKTYTISFDPKFLLESIDSLNATNLLLEFTNEISPFKITEVGNEKNIQVISPIRLT